MMYAETNDPLLQPDVTPLHASAAEPVVLVDAAAGREVVEAQVCDKCSRDLRIASKEADVQAAPIADDLATLPLDLLIDARGGQRVGPNPFNHAGLPA